MHLTHLIIDDFFNNPMKMREQALDFTYPERHGTEVYPGRNAATQLNVTGIERLISEIVQEPLKPSKVSSHGLPRIAMEGDEGNNMAVHMDQCHWSGIIYLSRDEDCQEGTHFFRHKATGWDMAPVWPGEAEKAGFKTPDEAVQTVMRDSTDRSKWEQTMTIQMKFNRLALFRGYLWHDAGVSFGTNRENARLILPIFFDNLRPR